MKNRLKYILAVVIVIITIAMSTISCFADIGTSDLGYQMTTMIPFSSIEIPILYKDQGNQYNSYVDNISYPYHHILSGESIKQQLDRKEFVTVRNNISNDKEGIRNLAALQNTKVYVNSSLWYELGLNKYSPEKYTRWTDTIIYSLPTMYYQAVPESKLEKVTELIFRWSEKMTDDVGDYYGFSIRITTDTNSDRTIINTVTNYIRSAESKFIIEYSQNNYNDFLDVRYPMPNAPYIDVPSDTNAIANIYKNRITFNVIGLTTTASFYKTKTMITERPIYTLSNNHLNVVTITSNLPNQLRGIYHIKADPFVISNKSDFQKIIETAPELYANKNQSTISIYFRYTILQPSLWEQSISDGENVSTEIVQYGLYGIEREYTETKLDLNTDNKLFLSSIPNFSLEFLWGLGTEHEETRTWNYNENPQPILISDLEITVETNFYQVPDESDYKYTLTIKQNYYTGYQLADNIETSSLYSRMRKTNNLFYKNSAVEYNADVDYYGFTVDRDELNVPPPEPWNFFDFISGTFEIFTVPIFGVFSIANILLTVIAIGVIFAVLKYFAGG